MTITHSQWSNARDGVAACRVGAGVLCACIMGCTLPSSRSMEPIADLTPTDWSQRSEFVGKPMALSQWWMQFSDPLLTQLVQEALDRNTDITQARAALKQAAALRDVAAAGLSPTLGVSANAQRTMTGDGNSADNLQAGLNGAWDPDIFGAKHLAVDSSLANMQSVQAKLGGVQGAVASGLALNYIQLRSAQLRLSIAQQNLASQLNILQITRWRNQAGLVGAIEIEQALAATEQTRAQLAPLEALALTTTHALAVQTGHPPAALLARLAPPTALPRLPTDTLSPTPLEVLQQRPDVRAALYQVSRAIADVDQAHARRYPVLNATANLGIGAATLAALSNASALVASAVLSLAVPWFDGGASKAQVEAQEAALVQSRAAYRAAVLLALQEVEDAMTALRTDTVREGQLQQAALSAGRAAAMARQRYGSGLIDFQVVLETQRTQLAAQDGEAQATASVSSDQVRLYNAWGGGWKVATP